MFKTDIFEKLKSEALEFTLRDDYLNRSYTKGFSNHVNSLFTCESELSTNPNLIINDNYKFSKRRYFEAETSVLESLDDIKDEHEVIFSNLEDELYDKIEGELGRYLDGSDEIYSIIDNTVHSMLLSIRFNFFTDADQYLNPWEESARIPIENKYLFKPIYDSEEFTAIKKLKKSSDKSEVLVDSDIYVAVKGRNKNLNYNSFKDFVRLRKVMLDLIDDKVGTRNEPVNFTNLAEELKKMGLDLTDNEIKSKLIYPLKAISKIGSCRDGYFILRTCDDIAKSYDSHYSRLKGYIRTLEAHRLAALRVDNNCFDFNKHKNL